MSKYITICPECKRESTFICESLHVIEQKEWWYSRVSDTGEFIWEFEKNDEEFGNDMEIKCKKCKEFVDEENIKIKKVK